MPRCIIIGCGSDSKATKQHEKDVSYHVFPRNTQLRNAWMNKIKQPFKLKADTSYVCSKHFVPDDFECNRLKEEMLKIKIKKQLKKTAIPSINLSMSNTSEETKNTHKYIRCVPIEKLIHKIDGDNKCEELLKNNESLCTPLNTDTDSLSQDKGCQVIIPCKGCKNRSFKINKISKERTRLLNYLNQNDAWRYPDEINTLKRMNGVLSLLLLQCVDKKNGERSPSIRVDLVQDSIERINRGWSMQDTSEILRQAFNINAYDEFANEFEMINEI